MRWQWAGFRRSYARALRRHEGFMQEQRDPFQGGLAVGGRAAVEAISSIGLAHELCSAPTRNHTRVPTPHSQPSFSHFHASEPTSGGRSNSGVGSKIFSGPWQGARRGQETARQADASGCPAELRRPPPESKPVSLRPKRRCFCRREGRILTTIHRFGGHPSASLVRHPGFKNKPAARR